MIFKTILRFEKNGYQIKKLAGKKERKKKERKKERKKENITRKEKVRKKEKQIGFQIKQNFKFCIEWVGGKVDSKY